MKLEFVGRRSTLGGGGRSAALSGERRGCPVARLEAEAEAEAFLRRSSS